MTDRCTFGVHTSRGPVREQNEDSFITAPQLGLFVVADGMGGHAGGEVAAQVVGDSIRTFIDETIADPDRTWPFAMDERLSDGANRLRTAVLLANRVLARTVAEMPDLRGTGTTVTAALLSDGVVAICHVGDSRLYLCRQGTLRQITSDHSFVKELVDAGLIGEDEVPGHPARNVVTRAVQGLEPLEVDVFEFAAESGDLLLLSTDGVHGVLSDGEIRDRAMAHAHDPQAACLALVDEALARGSRDNATALIVQVVDGAAAAPPTPPSSAPPS